jgi:uncharacterized XkdX family phage protein
MAKTDKLEKVKRFYDDGLWNAAQVAAAVGKGWITAAEYESITGDAYESQ